MENGKYNNLREFEEYGDGGGISRDEGCAFLHARGHGRNVRLP